MLIDSGSRGSLSLSIVRKQLPVEVLVMVLHHFFVERRVHVVELITSKKINSESLIIFVDRRIGFAIPIVCRR